MRRLLCLAILGAMVAPAHATIIVDGTLDAGYGPALAVQTVLTRYGDEDGIGAPSGGELDAAYAKVWNGRLYLMLTGNIEIDNFNKMSVFIDSLVGGENTLTATPDYDSESSPGIWRSNKLGGLKFDAGFTADYHMFARNNYEVDFVNRMGGGSEQVLGAHGADSMTSGSGSNVISSGTIAAGQVGPNASGSSLTQLLEFAVNDSNTAGVLGCSGTFASHTCTAADQTAALAVTTGMEFSIDLADLGNPANGTEIKITAVYGNDGFSDFSNQFLGGLPAPHWKYDAAHLPFDLSAEAGNQYFSVFVGAEVPEPASLALVGLSLVGLALGSRGCRS